MKKLFTFIYLVSFVFSFAQTDYNNYKTLRSSGAIPEDFSEPTKQKIEESLNIPREGLSKKEQKLFVYGTNYGIDKFMHSGQVVYGDPISLYVQKVAQKLLVNDPALYNSLRFYTYKSNETNAFSTDQGIIFVTTGLISQLENEAQLALVLGHEIAHYVKKHTLENFKFELKQKHPSINDLSKYSKENELEADKEGLKYYVDAGYSKDEVLSTFDVLLYSYLPFDEIKVPSTYWNTPQFYVPETMFPKEEFPIKAVEDVDDSESTHPNIKNRKLEMEKHFAEYSSWGSALFVVGEAEFAKIREIARFESIRTDIIDGALGNALYSIFLLEQKYPNSNYLKRMKMHCYYDMLLYREGNSIASVVKSKKELEGESSKLHFFIKKLTKEGLITLVLRNIYDLQKQFPKDPEANQIYNRTIDQLASYKEFKLSNYSKVDFNVAYNEFLAKQNATETKNEVKDTVQVKSKYDRIKKKKENDLSVFDSSKFYLYGISDIVQDSIFLQKFNKAVIKFQEKEKEKEEIKAMSKEQYKKYLKNKEKTKKESNDYKELIVVEPYAISVNNYGNIDFEKTLKLEEIYTENIEQSSLENGIKSYPINSNNLAKGGTEAYNERNILLAFLHQIGNEDNIEVFPVDYSELQDIKTNYGTSKTMFTIVEHQDRFRLNIAGMVICTITVFPIPYYYFIYLPMKIANANYSEMDILIIDIEEGKVDLAYEDNFKEPTRKINLQSHLYNFYQFLKKSSK